MFLSVCLDGGVEGVGGQLKWQGGGFLWWQVGYVEGSGPGGSGAKMMEQGIEDVVADVGTSPKSLILFLD